MYEIDENFQGFLMSSDGGVTIFADTANATIQDDDSKYDWPLDLGLLKAVAKV